MPFVPTHGGSPEANANTIIVGYIAAAVWVAWKIGKWLLATVQRWRRR